MNHRRGFALLAVLWVVVLVGALSTTAVARARDSHHSAERHIGLVRGRWAAMACGAVIRARIEERLRARNELVPLVLDTIVLENGSRCTARAFDTGMRVNDSMPELLTRLDSVLAVRGASHRREEFTTRLGDGRVNVAGASEEVLLSLPGFSEDAVRALVYARSWSAPPRDLGSMLSLLPPAAREAVASHYQTLIGLTSFAATSLVVESIGWHSNGPPALVEQMLVNGGNRAAIVHQMIR